MEAALEPRVPEGKCALPVKVPMATLCLCPPDVKQYSVFVGHGLSRFSGADGAGAERLNIQRMLKVNRTLYIGDRYVALAAARPAPREQVQWVQAKPRSGGARRGWSLGGMDGHGAAVG